MRHILWREFVLRCAQKESIFLTVSSSEEKRGPI